MASSLGLLADYESESDEDCHHDKLINDTASASRLPLPNVLQILRKEEQVDEPEKHDGKIRNYPHQRGNWNSIIFIPFNRSGSFDLLCDQIIDVCNSEIELKRIEDPHISLTRTFILLYHWIDNFVSSLKKCLSTFYKYEIQFDNLKIYCNEEKTRTFLAMSVGFGKMEISKSVHILDSCLADFKLNPFYEEASFHMSILWCFGNKKKELENLLPKINQIYEANINNSLDISFSISKYVCKIGNKTYNINLV